MVSEYVLLLVFVLIDMEPRFRKRSDGNINMCVSSTALEVREENKKRPWSRALSPVSPNLHEELSIRAIK